ncbi:MAG: hypothetical protein KDD35_08145, partial [Bdellovibrionales bacterium]|nr:hypothetical protein [Bdellovibrionales bacterium]
LKRFVYTSEFANMSVPIFDGVVIDAPTGIPDVNVSLKYASIGMKKEDIDTLLESLDGRLNYDWEFAHLDHPAEWFRKFVGPVSYSGHGKNGKSILYQHHIKVTEMLIKIFDLFQDAESDVFSKRELRTVLDMRDHGYSFDFVRKPEVLERVSKIVEAKQQQNQSLTLLWDDRRVIEFTPQEVRISDTNF